MKANKTLIVYGTRKGITTRTVSIITETLKDRFSHIVDISDTKQIGYYKKRLQEYNNVIIGSSIVSGRWKSRILSFAKGNIFENKRVAIFVTAGGTLNKVNKYGITKEAAVDEAIEKYIEKYNKKFKFTPISKGAFGGKVIKKGVEKYNSWNKKDIYNWAIDLGEKLKE
jgi:menaquinone-dependent protoporphyrinogen IX oxidase